MNYEFHPEAEQEFYEAAIRYQSDVPALGRRFRDEVERVIQLLLQHPEMGASVDENLRQFVLRRFPFSVVYAVIVDRIYIVAIAHGRRESRYWRARVKDR